MTSREFSKGMSILAVTFGREQTPLLMEAYFSVLKDLTAEEWNRAVTSTLQAESFFPPPAILLKYARPVLPKARAAEFYVEILSQFESGRVLGPREISERFGTAAMEAFVSAGGVRAFQWCEPRDEPFRRKAFLEAWSECVGLNPSLLPEGDKAKLLASGE